MHLPFPYHSTYDTLNCSRCALWSSRSAALSILPKCQCRRMWRTELRASDISNWEKLRERLTVSRFSSYSCWFSDQVGILAHLRPTCIFWRKYFKVIVGIRNLNYQTWTMFWHWLDINLMTIVSSKASSPLYWCRTVFQCVSNRVI